jgi:ABC-type branched-subunit amino acid transport system substrate-binding protein
VASGPRPCAAPSDAPGVTDDTITIGGIFTNSGPLPGLGEPSMQALRAYAAYRNATGGVCGRDLVVRTGDDGSENARFRAVLQEMARSTLGLAAGFAAGDGGGVDVLQQTGMFAVTTAFSDQFQDAPNSFDVNPSPPDRNAVIAKFRYLYDQGVRKAAIATIAQAVSLAQLNLQQDLMEAAGIQVVNRQELPLSTFSFDAAARAVVNSGADYFLFLGAGTLNSGMARSLKDAGYDGKFNEFLTSYGSNFIEMAGDAAEGVTSWSRSLPNEERGSNDELDAFIEWMGRSAPGTPPDTIAADGWVSARAFTDALEGLSGPISREAMIAQLRSMHEFNARGFFGTIDLGAKKSNNCYVAMQVVNGRWQRLVPESGFIC